MTEAYITSVYNLIASDLLRKKDASLDSNENGRTEENTRGN